MANLDVLIAKAKARSMTAAQQRNRVVAIVLLELIERADCPNLRLEEIFEAYDKSERERNT